MNFEEIVDIVFSDDKTFNIPALYIVQILLVLNNHDLLKGVESKCTTDKTETA